MRQHFVVLQQARNRVMELAAEIEACMGDTLDAVSNSRIREEAPTSDPVLDPTARRRPRATSSDQAKPARTGSALPPLAPRDQMDRV